MGERMQVKHNSPPAAAKYLKWQAKTHVIGTNWI